MTVEPTSGWLDFPSQLAPSGPARTRASMRSNSRALLPLGAAMLGVMRRPPKLTSTRPSMACVNGGRRFWLRLFDKQALFRFSGLQGIVEPARALAAAGPGHRRIGGIAIFRGNLAALAATAAATTVQVGEGETLGLDQGVHLGANLGGAFLAEIALAGVCLANQLIELIGVERFQINGHDDSSGLGS